MINPVFEGATLAEVLPSVLSSALSEGRLIESRNGNALELLMARIHLSAPHLNPYSTNAGRKASLPAQIAETVWLLSGRDDIKFIEPFLPRAKDFSDDGITWRGAYGPRIRDWNGVDQLRAVAEILTKDPSSRRAVINIFDPAVDFQDSKDIPCNNWLSFSIRDGVLHTHVAVRSNDAFWGLSGINAFEWTFLSQALAYLVGANPGSLTFSTTSLHLYEPHWERAEKLVGAAQGDAEGTEHSGIGVGILHGAAYGGSPEARLDGRWGSLHRGLQQLETFLESDLSATALDKATEGQPIGLFVNWARAVYDWKHETNELEKAAAYNGPLLRALHRSPKPKAKASPAPPPVEKAVPAGKEFLPFIDELHKEKNLAYGDSWRRRGEILGILANVARKVDRLGRPGAGDSNLDTNVDLLLYLAKYSLWLNVEQGYLTDAELSGERHHAAVMRIVRDCGRAPRASHTDDDLIHKLTDSFEQLATAAESRAGRKHVARMLESMIGWAYDLALSSHRAEFSASRQFTGYDV